MHWCAADSQMSRCDRTMLLLWGKDKWRARLQGATPGSLAHYFIPKGKVPKVSQGTSSSSFAESLQTTIGGRTNLSVVINLTHVSHALPSYLISTRPAGVNTLNKHIPSAATRSPAGPPTRDFALCPWRLPTMDRRKSSITHTRRKSAVDDATLAKLGHKAELDRNFSPLAMLGLAFAILNSWTALSASLSLALPSGGPVAVIWGLITAGICNLCLAASLAEFLSAYPTAGGQYHWVAVISWEKWVPLLSWICGWINVFGWIALTQVPHLLLNMYLAHRSTLIVSDCMTTYSTFSVSSNTPAFQPRANNKVLQCLWRSARESAHCGMHFLPKCHL